MAAHDRPATVYLVGAGPGDAGLVTVRGRDLLGRADAVLYDRLASTALLDHVPHDAERFFVGKQGHEAHVSQDDVNDLLVETARRIGREGGATVVRLKGGDPFVFGRGGEEAAALANAGVPFEVVPGVTSGIAALAYAGIPATHRGLASSVTLVTGHEAPGKRGGGVDWDALAALAAGGGTICFYMGMHDLAAIAERLMSAGVSRDTPTAVIQWATTDDQRSMTAPLERLVADAAQAGLGVPAIVAVGKVAQMHDSLDWLSMRPLHGKGIIVTRPRAQAGGLSTRLRELGARVLEFPTIEICAPDSYDALDEAITSLSRYRWIVFTSVNGANAFFERLGGDARKLGGALVAAIGPATAQRLAERGIVADAIPREYRAEAVFDAMRKCGATGRVLMPCAQEARAALPELLRKAGMPVDVVPAYRTALPRDSDVEDLVRAIESGEADTITFTSPSTVRNMVTLLGDESGLLGKLERYSIGPITSAALREAGFPPTAEATDYTARGLANVLAASRRGSPVTRHPARNHT